jgi:hypothetical protein
VLRSLACVVKHGLRGTAAGGMVCSVQLCAAGASPVMRLVFGLGQGGQQIRGCKEYTLCWMQHDAG